MPSSLPGWTQRARGLQSWQTVGLLGRRAEVGQVPSPDSLSREDACSWGGGGLSKNLQSQPLCQQCPGALKVEAGRVKAEESNFYTFFK